MNTREIASEYRLGQWAQAMKGRIEAGESIDEFCQAKGISRNTYFYWQRKLREAACEHAADSAGRRSLIPSGWAMCRASPTSSESKALIIEIGTFRVQVEANTDPELLKSVCHTLASLC
jgi:putative transposase